MSFLDLAHSRYSVRKFSDARVEKEKLLKVLEAARLAPSAVNYQPINLVIITDEVVKAKLAEAYNRQWFKQAPVIIAACGDHSLSWKRSDGKDHCDIDVAIAVDYMTLAAADLGLGTCWVCAFDAEKAHDILELPDNLEVIVLLPLGYPADDGTGEKRRKSLDDIVSWKEG